MFLYGQPIVVTPDADRRAMEVKRLELQSALDRLTSEAETLAREVSRPGRHPEGLR